MQLWSIRWKKFKVVIIIVCLFLFIALGLFFYLQKPQEVLYITPPKPILNWKIDSTQNEVKKNQFQKNKKIAVPSKEKRKKRRMNISICEDNPNAPDYLSKRMEDVRNNANTCAKLKLDMDLNFQKIIRFFLDNLK